MRKISHHFGLACKKLLKPTPKLFTHTRNSQDEAKYLNSTLLAKQNQTEIYEINFKHRQLL